MSDAPAAITWLGHATALIEAGGARLLTDPVLGSRVGPLVRIAPPLAADDVGDIDAVLLSHLHADHAHLPSLRRLAGDPRILAPAGSGDWLRAAGLKDVSEMAPGETTAVNGVPVLAIPAEHEQRRRPLGGPSGTPVGFVVGERHGIYFAGDTDLFDGLEALRGTVEVALLPVWGWGPSAGPGHLDPQRAAQAAVTIAPAVAIPIHYATLARGRPFRRPRDPEKPARKFAALVGELSPGIEVRLLAPGERTEVTRFG